MFTVHLYNFSSAEMDSVFVKERRSVDAGILGTFTIDSLETRGDSISHTAGYTIYVPYSYFLAESMQVDVANDVVISFAADTLNYSIGRCTIDSFYCSDCSTKHNYTIYKLQSYYANGATKSGPEFNIYK
jgi:predicted RNA-binding protein with TRAM domain